MEYKDFIKEFYERTAKNLIVIEELYGKSVEYEVFETTQLINSLIGMLIFPQQNLFNKIKDNDTKFEIDCSYKLGKNSSLAEYSNIKFSKLLRHMRNAVAHARIEQKTSNGDIIGFTLEDKDEAGNVVFKADFMLDEIKDIVRKLSEDYLS